MAVRTFGLLFLKGEEIIIDKAEPHVCIKLKALFAKLCKGTAQPFRFVKNPENASDLLWFMDRYPLEMAAGDFKAMKRLQARHRKTIADLERIHTPDYQPTDPQLKDGKAARHYQIIGRDTFLACKRILIGDDIGLGKTLIGIISCLEKGLRPAAVVVQTHMPKQWQAAVEEFTSLTTHIIKKTRPYSLPVADLYIFKYSALAGWSDFFATGFFKAAIFDEIQELRHDESDRYNGARTLSANVDYLLGLSASPIYNYGDEIHNVMEIVKPGTLGSKQEFRREWCSMFSRVVHNPQALGSYLRENFLMLRRTRKEVGKELPPINKIVYTVGYDTEAVKASEDIARQLAIKATSGSFMERGLAARELDILVRQTTGVSKAREVAQFVRILLANNEPIVLAAWHREVYNILLEELSEFKPVMYTGSESASQKEKAKQAFVNGETNLFIISLRSGVGLDGLQLRSNIIVLAELDWSPKVHDQLIGRLDRDKQTEQVTAIFLVSEYGSDPLIIDLLGLKSSQSHNILNPLAAVEQQYSDESRLKLLAEKFLHQHKSHPTP